MPLNVVSSFGIVVFLLVAWLCSNNRKNINWRVVVWGLGLQFIFAVCIFWLPVGTVLFRWLNTVVIKFLSFAKEGAYFVFGVLAVGPGEIGPGAEQSLGFILAFQALPTLIFFSSLMALLYYFGILQIIIRGFAKIFAKLMRISGAESLCASSNIFVGIESALTIRPYLDKMTLSELCTVLTVGMATIASTVLALYVSFLQSQFPAIAGHLISASVLSAPAAIIISKLIYPEDKIPKTLGQITEVHYTKEASWIEAIIRGANEGVKLCVGIVALLLAFLGLLAMVNWFFSSIGIGISSLTGMNFDLSIQGILKYIFYFFTTVIGVPLKDIPLVSKLLAERLVATELVAYRDLAILIKNNAFQDQRSIILAAYALCGFAHIASLAIFIGGISALAPNRAKDLAKLGLRALIAANLACLMTASIAGVFFRAESILFNP
jgi:CNT family concentrative nucleoside transporter